MGRRRIRTTIVFCCRLPALPSNSQKSPPPTAIGLAAIVCSSVSPSSSSPPTAIGLAKIVCSSVSAIEFSGGIRIYLCRLGLHLFGSSWFR
ncbi:hypothetical protein L2E82_16683 [Cichorium intybus]|uniref:Uncharacterized protein n=1 Tax=Cichorium intybus TaxID=13427 RepID=A0ACB9F6U8_CICIN|nr:hypothetical protein L2E82_16683 [Cichorium intybus]